MAIVVAGAAEFGQVHRVHDIDAVGEEGALTEAEYLAAEAQFHGHVLAELELGLHVEVEPLAPVGHLGLGFAREGGAQGAVGQEILEVVAPGKEAEIMVVELEFVGALEQLRDPALPVVEVAIVGIDLVLLAGNALVVVGRAVQLRAGSAQAVESAEGERAVEAAGQVTIGELEGMRGWGQEQRAEGKSQGRACQVQRHTGGLFHRVLRGGKDLLGGPSGRG